MIAVLKAYREFQNQICLLLGLPESVTRDQILHILQSYFNTIGLSPQITKNEISEI